MTEKNRLKLFGKIFTILYIYRIYNQLPGRSLHMDKTPQYNNITSLDLLAKVSKLIPSLPRIIKNIKKVKAVNGDSNQSIGKIIAANALNHGSTCALKYENQSYTYSEFDHIVNRYANYLLHEGIKNGETVISFLENRPELLFLIAACAKIGAIISLINPNQKGKVLIHSIQLAKSSRSVGWV